MQFRRLLAAVSALALAISLMRTGVVAQASRPRYVIGTGFITERLSAKQLKRWEAIKRLALAEDANRQPLQPTLKRLFDWVETSGHAIYIELPDSNRAQRTTAGVFGIERFDPLGIQHTGVIRLYLTNIDQAYVGPRAVRTDGLIPLQGLLNEERYAEVLGHELAHAYYVLTDLRRARMVEETIEQTNDLLLSNNAWHSGQTLGLEMQQRLDQRDSMLVWLEIYAEIVETAVWRELTASQKERGGGRKTWVSANR